MTGQLCKRRLQWDIRETRKAQERTVELTWEGNIIAVADIYRARVMCHAMLYTLNTTDTFRLPRDPTEW